MSFSRRLTMPRLMVSWGFLVRLCVCVEMMFLHFESVGISGKHCVCSEAHVGWAEQMNIVINCNEIHLITVMFTHSTDTKQKTEVRDSERRRREPTMALLLRQELWQLWAVNKASSDHGHHRFVVTYCGCDVRVRLNIISTPVTRILTVHGYMVEAHKIKAKHANRTLALSHTHTQRLPGLCLRKLWNGRCFRSSYWAECSTLGMVGRACSRGTISQVFTIIPPPFSTVPRRRVPRKRQELEGYLQWHLPASKKSAASKPGRLFKHIYR